MKSTRPELKSIILEAFKHGFRMWSPSMPFGVSEDEKSVYIKVSDGSVQEIDADKILKNPIIQKIWPEKA